MRHTLFSSSNTCTLKMSSIGISSRKTYLLDQTVISNSLILDLPKSSKIGPSRSAEPLNILPLRSSRTKDMASQSTGGLWGCYFTRWLPELILLLMTTRSLFIRISWRGSCISLRDSIMTPNLWWSICWWTTWARGMVIWRTVIIIWCRGEWH